MRKYGSSMKAVKFERLFHIEGAVNRICCHHLTEFFLIQGVKGVALSDRTLLRRIVILINGSPLPRAHFWHPLAEGQPGNCALLIVEIFFREVFHSKELPPFHLLFATVPIQSVREQPARCLFGIAIPWFSRQTLSQRVKQRDYAPLVSVDLITRGRILCCRPRDFRAACN